jgi:hypothetical protein
MPWTRTLSKLFKCTKSCWRGCTLPTDTQNFLMTQSKSYYNNDNIYDTNSPNSFYTLSMTKCKEFEDLVRSARENPPAQLDEDDAQYWNYAIEVSSGYTVRY